MVKDKIDELLELTDKDLDIGKAYFPSSSFSLTLNQIRWLKKFPNRSLLIRLLLEGAMLSDRGVILVYIERIERLERIIEDLIYKWKRTEAGYDKKAIIEDIRKLQKRRRKLIAALIKPPE